MSFVAVIVSIAGDERFLGPHHETFEEKKARKFRSEAAAEKAAKAHVEAFPRCISRQMRFRVEPRS
jgi:hypothetical protein